MDPVVIFPLQFGFSLAVYSLLARWFLAPWLDAKPKHEALVVLILPHVFRHIGMSFFVPGVVAEPLPAAFAGPAAYGDLLSAVLAVLAIAALRNGWQPALVLVWVFNTVGFADLLNAIYQGLRLGLLEQLGAAWYIPTFLVPALLVTHIMVFGRLLGSRR